MAAGRNRARPAGEEADELGNPKVVFFFVFFFFLRNFLQVQVREGPGPGANCRPRRWVALYARAGRWLG